MRGATFHTGSHQRSFGNQERHGLTLHVRTHEGSVGVVVLQERNQRGRNGHHLARRNVHVGDVIVLDEHGVLAGDAALHEFIAEGAIGVRRR